MSETTLQEQTHFLIYEIDKLEDFSNDDTTKVAEEYNKQHNLENGTCIEVNVSKRNYFLYASTYQKQGKELIYLGHTFGC